MVKRWSISITLCLSAVVALAGSTALGQDEQPSSPTPADQVATAVEGTSTLVGEAAAGSTTVDGAIVRVRDNVLITMEESSDPRTSGRGVDHPRLRRLPGCRRAPGRRAGALGGDASGQRRWLVVGALRR